jgi:SPP1 gp7 family putative phage head morphogenesis protein
MPSPKASDRAKQRAAAKLLKASVAAETAYVRALRAVMHQVHLGTMRALAPHLGLHTDANGRISPHDQILTILGVTVRTHVRMETARAFDKMAVAVNKKNAAGNRALVGISPGTSVLDDIARFREQNLALMAKASETYLDRVKAVIEAPENFAIRVEGLAKQLQQAVGSSAWDAERIARDQTLKLNSQLSQTRQKNAGITKYRWSTSLDERVRPYHRALEGTVHDYGDPPVTDKYGNRNDPGQDILCRCLAIPLLQA